MFFNVLMQASRLDIYDLNYNFSSPKMEHHLFASKTGLPRKGVLLRLVAFLWHWARSLKDGLVLFCASKSPVLFFAITRNQESALSPVAQAVDGRCFVGAEGYGEVPLPLCFAYGLSCLYLPLVFIRWLTASGYARRSFDYAFDKYLLTYGYYVMWRRWLRRLHPRCVVVSNDHIMWTRVLVKAASDAGVPTLYMQHASIVDYFPPLNFDYALLDGLDALKKYAACGASATRVFLVGTPKFDAYFEAINRKPKVEAVGICTGHWLALEDVEKVCQVLTREFPQVRFVLRPHPGDSRFEDWRALAEQGGLAFSDSVHERAFAFLRGVDAVIASDSNILLEAALLNVYPIYYDFASTRLDLYGFLRHGLVDYFADPQALSTALAALLVAKPDIRFKAKYYCATVGTRYDGRSRALAASLIEASGSHSGINLEGWQRVADVALDAYTCADA